MRGPSRGPPAGDGYYDYGYDDGYGGYGDGGYGGYGDGYGVVRHAMLQSEIGTFTTADRRLAATSSNRQRELSLKLLNRKFR